MRRNPSGAMPSRQIDRRSPVRSARPRQIRLAVTPIGQNTGWGSAGSARPSRTPPSGPRRAGNSPRLPPHAERTSAAAAIAPAALPTQGPTHPHASAAPRQSRDSTVLKTAATPIMRCRKRDGTILRCTSEYQRAVGSAKPEGVFQRVIDLQVTRGVGAVVQIAFGIGIGQIDGGRRNLVINGQHGDHRFDAAGSSQQVPGHRLGA